MTKMYIGTKIVTAWPEVKNGLFGYAVKYPDGYVSWSPQDAFEDAYGAIEGDEQFLSFSEALFLLNSGRKLARRVWTNVCGDEVAYVVYASTDDNDCYTDRSGDCYQIADHLGIIVGGEYTPWMPNSTDLMADDWFVVE